MGGPINNLEDVNRTKHAAAAALARGHVPVALRRRAHRIGQSPHIAKIGSTKHWTTSYKTRSYLIKSKKTKPFQRLCKSIEGNRFLDLANTTPITTPRNISGSILCTLKCARAKATELTSIAHHTGMYLVKEGSKKPRKTISSHTGAQTETTIAYNAIATGSRAIIDCSTLEMVTGADGIRGNRLRLNCESRLTRGNMRHPNATSSCQFPFKLNLNQSDGRGWNRDRHRCRIAIPASPSVTSVTRLNKACPLKVRDSLLKPATWAANGITQEPINQNAATHRSITCIIACTHSQLYDFKVFSSGISEYLFKLWLNNSNWWLG